MTGIQEFGPSECVASEPLTGRMRAQVHEAIEAAEHLEITDEASVELALQLAEIIDNARDSGDPAAFEKTSFGPMPTLHKVLTLLGLNPEGRQKLNLDSGEENDEW